MGILINLLAHCCLYLKELLRFEIRHLFHYIITLYYFYYYYYYLLIYLLFSDFV